MSSADIVHIDVFQLLLIKTRSSPSSDRSGYRDEGIAIGQATFISLAKLPMRILGPCYHREYPLVFSTHWRQRDGSRAGVLFGTAVKFSRKTFTPAVISWRIVFSLLEPGQESRWFTGIRPPRRREGVV